MIAVALALATWVALPAVAAQLVTGETTGPLAVHPATLLVLAVFAVQLLFRPRPIGSAVARYPLLVVRHGDLRRRQPVDEHRQRQRRDSSCCSTRSWRPLLVFVLLVASARGNRRDVMILRNTVLALAALESVLTIVQAAAGSDAACSRSYYADAAVVQPVEVRPLDGHHRLAADPRLPALRRRGARRSASERVGLRLALLGLYLVSVLITQSRIGVAVICAVILYTVLRSRMAIWARALASVIVVAAGYVLLTSTLVAGFASRLADDTGSADARQRALGLHLRQLGRLPVRR